MDIERSRAPTAPDGGGLQGGHLPEWFLFELLARLPVKDVFRSNCVSKQWASFIADPSFRPSYLSRQPSPLKDDQFVFFPTRCRRGDGNPDGIGLKYPERHLFTLPMPPLEGEGPRKGGKKPRFVINETWFGGGTFYSVADDKGFLLVSWVFPVDVNCKQDRCRGEFFICSAMTQQWFRLPSSPPNPFAIESVGFVTKVDESGRHLTSFRVVIIESTVENIVGTFVPDYVDIHVFSSETRAWAPIRLQIGRPFMFYRWQRAFVVNNSVYWTDDGNRILGYDPYGNPNELRIIKPPPREGRFPSGYSICGGSQGRLKYFEKITSMSNGRWTDLKIWQLQEEEEKENHWCLQHTIRVKDVNILSDAIDIFNLSTAIFLSFDQLDPDIVYLNMHKNIGVASFNLQTKSMELLDPSSFIKGDIHTVGNYRWFLLKLPPWPNLIPPHVMC